LVKSSLDISSGEIKRRKTCSVNTGYGSLAHSCSVSALTEGRLSGTNRPPSGAYPEQIASSKLQEMELLRVDVYFIVLCSALVEVVLSLVFVDSFVFWCCRRDLVSLSPLSRRTKTAIRKDDEDSRE
jgi:hypothetical protein